MDIKTDCFAYMGSRRREGCGVMKELICSKRSCSFYKTREQYEKDREKYGGVPSGSGVPPEPKAKCMGRRVRCIDTGEVFPTVRSAAQAKGMHPNSVSRAIKLKCRAGGLRWENAK